MGGRGGRPGARYSAACRASIKGAAVSAASSGLRISSKWLHEPGTTQTGGRFPPRKKLETMGSLPVGATVGNSPRGLLGGRRLLDLFPARPRAQPRLPMGRGWFARNLRPAGPSLFRSVTLEWPGRHSERTPVWSRDQGRQSWRRRQGVLLLSGFDAHPFVYEGTV